MHDYRASPLREIVAAVAARAEIAEAELIGLAPEAAFEGFPAGRATARVRPGAAPARERTTIRALMETGN